jgi:hypothetical protein
MNVTPTMNGDICAILRIFKAEREYQNIIDKGELNYL